MFHIWDIFLNFGQLCEAQHEFMTDYNWGVSWLPQCMWRDIGYIYSFYTNVYTNGAKPGIMAD